MDRRRRRPAAERRVTLDDVARFAQVSSAVVSYVINDGPRPVAPDTADRVREAVRVLGYRPNSHARALSTGRAGILGLIVPSTANPFFGEYNEVLTQSAAQAGQALLTVGSSGHADEERHLIDSLARRGVDGILVVSSMVPADVARLHPSNVPLVFLNCPFPVPGHVSIGPDAKLGAQLGVAHLLDVHGSRTVALIAGDTGAAEPDEREVGWMTAHQVAGRAIGPRVKAPFSLRGGYLATRELLATRPVPDAIFASSDLQAQGALSALYEAGLKAPEDIALVAFDGTAPSAFTSPPLTVVRQPQQAMAEAGVQALLERTGPRHMLYPTELVLRRSCGCGVG